MKMVQAMECAEIPVSCQQRFVTYYIEKELDSPWPWAQHAAVFIGAGDLLSLNVG